MDSKLFEVLCNLTQTKIYSNKNYKYFTIDNREKNIDKNISYRNISRYSFEELKEICKDIYNCCSDNYIIITREKVVELLKDYNEINLKEKSTADYLINGTGYKGRIKFTQNDRKELSEYFDDVCDCCGKSVIFCGVNIGEFHHKKQVSKGGNTSIINLALLCPNCHTIMHKVFLSNGIEYDKAKEEIKKMM